MLPVAVCLLALAQPVQMPELRITTNAFWSRYGELRSAPSQAFKDHIALMEVKDDPLSALVMSLVDGYVLGSQTPQDLRASIEQLPEDWSRGTLTRDWLLKLSEILGDVPSGNDARLLDLQKKIESDKVLPRAWSWLADKLGIEGAPKTLDIVLVPEFAAPGAVTLRTQRGVKILISAKAFEGSALTEAILHEAIHACEAKGTSVNVLAGIRSAPSLVELSSQHRQHLPHTLYFLAAAEAVRQAGASDHQDVGENTGVYKRGLEPYRRHLAPLWVDYVAGKMDSKEFIERAAQFRPAAQRIP
jgi:hypothetical protein